MDTRLFINTNGNYAEVDLYNDIDIPVTYNVGDVRDISKKDSNWSLTVKLPNTQSNAQLFELNNDISRYNSTFEMLKQYPAFVEVGCNRTFEGYFKLTKVIINDDKEVVYEGNLYSNVIEFMSRLGTTTLRGNVDPADDLSFSEYTISDLSAANWFTYTDMFYWDTPFDPQNPPHPTGYKPFGKGCYFAPIDKYDLGNRLSEQDIHNGSVPIFFDELTPFLFYKEILDKIFKWAGFNYVSDFINNTANNTTTFEFDHLAYPHTGPIEPQVDYENYNRLVQDYIPFGMTSLSHHNFYGWILTDNPVFSGWQKPIYGDQSNSGSISIESLNCNSAVLNQMFWKFTATNGGVYTVDVHIPWQMSMILADPTPPGQQLTYFGDVYCNDPDWEQNARFWVRLIKKHNGNEEIVAQDVVAADYNQTYTAVNGVVGFIDERLFSDSVTVHLAAGDELYIACGFDDVFEERPGGLLLMTCENGGSPFGCAQWFTFIFKPLDYTVYGTNRMIDIQRTSDFYVDGIFDPTVILNPKRKKTDFISDIIKKFNLYIEDVTNKKDDNGVYYRDYAGIRPNEPILRIEPRNLFYDNTSIVRDFTKKTDVSSIEFERISDYLYKQILLNDDNDKTFLTEDYNNYLYTEGEYGEEIIVSPYNVSGDEKTEITTKLGQTMCSRPLYPNNKNKYIECPSLFTINNDTIKKDKEYDDRMLFVFNVYGREDTHNVYGFDFSNIRNTSQLKSWSLYYRNDEHPDEFDYFYQSTGTYILLDHLNIPFGNDTADLNFGWANWYYQYLDTSDWVTPNNTYNVFYKDMIDDYNSPEARLMRCKMYLKSSDIRDLQLSDTIIVNNVAYHINKIKQWRSEYEPTEVELIKIIQSTSKPNQPILKNNKPPKMEIVTLNTLKELIESQNKAISQISKQVEKMDGTIKKMDEQLIKLDERVKKLEEGEKPASDDGSGEKPESDEKDNIDYD